MPNTSISHNNLKNLPAISRVLSSDKRPTDGVHPSKLKNTLLNTCQAPKPARK